MVKTTDETMPFPPSSSKTRKRKATSNSPIKNKEAKPSGDYSAAKLKIKPKPQSASKAQTAVKPQNARKLQSTSKPQSAPKMQSTPKTQSALETQSAPKTQSAGKTKKEISPKIKETEIKSGQRIPDTEKYPILENHEIIKKFSAVPMSNNQKGRIRQAIKESLQGTSNELIPSIINGKIRDILHTTDNLTDPQLRRIRILYNLLKTALKTDNVLDTIPQKIKKNAGDADKGDKSPVKTKKQKRYVVFLGNLPPDVDKEKIMNHFSEMNEQIKDIRIPEVKDGKKSAIAYVELTNEPSYEFALSKHHSMLGKRRIKVLYTTQKNGRITKAEAKSKSAKLIALQKAGKLVGSTPLMKKRSQRRLKVKLAMAREAAAGAV